MSTKKKEVPNKKVKLCMEKKHKRKEIERTNFTYPRENLLLFVSACNSLDLFKRSNRMDVNIAVARNHRNSLNVDRSKPYTRLSFISTVFFVAFSPVSCQRVWCWCSAILMNLNMPVAVCRYGRSNY